MGDPYGDLRQDVTGHFLCMCRYIRVYEFIRQSTLSYHTGDGTRVRTHSVELTYVCVVWYVCTNLVSTTFPRRIYVRVYTWRIICVVVWYPRPGSKSKAMCYRALRMICMCRYTSIYIWVRKTAQHSLVHWRRWLFTLAKASRWARSFIFTQGCVHARMLILVCWPISMLEMTPNYSSIRYHRVAAG